MQKALGEKIGAIILSFGMTFAGVAFGFAKGWSFSLVLLAAIPVIAIGISLMDMV
jgi:hypothetical protein